MILVILGICILMLIISSIIDVKSYDFKEVCLVFLILSGFGVLMCLVIAISLGIKVSKLSVINEQIEMYQKENTKIEQQVANVVSQYQEYETKTFTAVTPEDSMTLVSLFPELKSDKLVQKQIDVYVENNKKIKSLKERQINGKVVKWWLYFGKQKECS